MKLYLSESALGMMPNTPWDGKHDATGGYIVVTKTGELLCYHLFRKNDFDDYLFHNVRFDTSSTSRHDHGKIYLNAVGQTMTNLNLQVRFDL